MRVYFFLLIVLLITSCKKDKEVKNLRKEIVGTWELESTSGMSGYNTLPPGNGQIIVLGENGSFA